MPLKGSLRGGDAFREDSIPVQIPRPASYTYLPLSTDSDTDVTSGGIKRTFSENVLATLDVTEEGVSSADTDLSTSQKRGDSPTGNSLDRRKSARPVVKPKITISKFALSDEQGKDDTAYESRGTVKARKSDREIISRSVSRSLSGFARKSWISGSRSPSPDTRSGQDFIQDGATSDLQASGLSRCPPKLLQTDKTVEKSEAPESAKSPSRKGTVLNKKTRRPLSAFLQKSTAETILPRSPSLTSLRKSLSSDKLPSLDRSLPSSERIPPMPRSMSTERLQSMGVDMSKKKDELWSAFRALDGDFHK